MWNHISVNRILTDKEKMLQRQKHLERLKAVKGRINNKPPLRPAILYELKPRIVKAKLQRNKEIEYQNETLLKKMILIDKRPSKLHPIQCKRDYPLSRSLNRSVRYQQLDMIYEQNRRLLERLQEASSVYSLNKWENEFAQNSYYGTKIKENSGSNWLRLARMGAWGAMHKRKTFSPDKQNTSSLMSGSTSTQNVNKTFRDVIQEKPRAKSSQRPRTSGSSLPRNSYTESTCASFGRPRLTDSSRRQPTPGPYSIQEQRRSSSKSSTPGKLRPGVLSSSGFPPMKEEEARAANIRKSSPLIQGVVDLKKRKEVFSSHHRHLSADGMKKKGVKVKSRKKSQKSETKEEDEENKAILVNMASPKND